MDLNLKGKVAIVTGGSKGIGKDISKSLALEGASVCIVARAQQQVQSTCDEIKALGGKAFGFSTDVTVQTEVADTVKKIQLELGSIDFLINNAGGVSKFGSFQECNEEDWISSFRLNVMGCVNFVKACENALFSSNQARIITISSIVGVQPGHFNPHYSVAKAASINLSKHFANIYAKAGILCNTICVGPVHSDSWQKNVSSIAEKNGSSFQAAYDDLEKSEIGRIPLGRVGEVEDISSIVTFLVSEKANWITGTCIHVSGGKYATMS